MAVLLLPFNTVCHLFILLARTPSAVLKGGGDS